MLNDDGFIQTEDPHIIFFEDNLKEGRKESVITPLSIVSMHLSVAEGPKAVLHNAARLSYKPGTVTNNPERILTIAKKILSS